MDWISIPFTNKAVKRKNIGGDEIQTRGCWMRSKNATSVLSSPPSAIILSTGSRKFILFDNFFLFYVLVARGKDLKVKVKDR